MEFDPLKPFVVQLNQSELYEYIKNSSIKRIDNAFCELFSPNLEDDKKMILFGCIKLSFLNKQFYNTLMRKCMKNCDITCLEGLESLNEFIKSYDDETYVYEPSLAGCFITKTSEATTSTNFMTPFNFIEFIEKHGKD
jgi:hypothetical protein